MFRRKPSDGAAVVDARGAPAGVPRAPAPWRPLGPTAAVLTLLLALVLLSVFVERRAVQAHEEMSRLGGPLRTTVGEVQLYLALETAGTRGFLLNGDAQFAARHQAARAARQAAVARLTALAREAGPETRGVVAQLASTLRPADALLDSLYGGKLSREAYMRRLPGQQRRLERTIGLVRRLDALSTARTVSLVGALEAAQRAALRITIALALLAAAAVVLVARLGISYRTMAERTALAHAESEAAREEAERVAESRARLVRGFTHDVKNPLGAAMGYLTLMEDGLLEPLAAGRRARRTVGEALTLIEELLRMERAHASEIAVHRQPFDLRDLVLDAVNDWRALAMAKGLALHASLPPELPLVESDRERVRQVVGNFLSNAVRYTPRGTVIVHVGLRPPDPGELQEWAFVEVEDTGPGLTDAQREELFQEYRRLATSEGTTGSGLGLAISKRVADALGGRILVRSRPGEGSTFTLLLPHGRVRVGTFAPPPPAPEPARDAEPRAT